MVYEVLNEAHCLPSVHSTREKWRHQVSCILKVFKWTNLSSMYSIWKFWSRGKLNLMRLNSHSFETAESSWHSYVQETPMFTTLLRRTSDRVYAHIPLSHQTYRMDLHGSIFADGKGKERKKGKKKKWVKGETWGWSHWRISNWVGTGKDSVTFVDMDSRMCYTLKEDLHSLLHFFLVVVYISWLTCQKQIKFPSSVIFQCFMK